MDEMNVSNSASTSTSAVPSRLVTDNTTESSCIDIEVDVELNPIQSVESPFPSRASTSFDGFDGGDSVSAQGIEGEDSVFAQGFDGEDSVSAQLSPLLPFYPTENVATPRMSQYRINWLRIIKFLVGVTVIIIVGIIATFVFMTKRGKTSLECKIKYTVSKDGKSDFTTVSEAVKASPSFSAHKVCIFIQAGEYREMVKIGKEKINLVLIGEGIGKTTISSNKSIEGSVPTWSPAPLRIRGKRFLAQDLSILNKAKSGSAVNNWAEYSVFFRCKLEAANATLFINGDRQFYHSCQLYGRNNLVLGYARAFFQKCVFLIEKSYAKEKIVFSIQSPHYLAYRQGLVFHLCAFCVDDKFQSSSESVFLGSSLGRYAFFVVMQSYLDASIGGYFLDTALPNNTFCAIFGNRGRGANMANMPPFVRLLDDVKASELSLRGFLGGDNWIPPGVEYDLDLLK
ncbi:hypothetical protein OROMI_003178 [Orobanche minor]